MASAIQFEAAPNKQVTSLSLTSPATAGLEFKDELQKAAGSGMRTASRHRDAKSPHSGKDYGFDEPPSTANPNSDPTALLISPRPVNIPVGNLSLYELNVADQGTPFDVDASGVNLSDSQRVMDAASLSSLILSQATVVNNAQGHAVVEAHKHPSPADTRNIVAEATVRPIAHDAAIPNNASTREFLTQSTGAVVSTGFLREESVKLLGEQNSKFPKGIGHNSQRHRALIGAKLVCSEGVYQSVGIAPDIVGDQTGAASCTIAPPWPGLPQGSAADDSKTQAAVIEGQAFAASSSKRMTLVTSGTAADVDLISGVASSEPSGKGMKASEQDVAEHGLRVRAAALPAVGAKPRCGAPDDAVSTAVPSGTVAAHSATAAQSILEIAVVGEAAAIGSVNLGPEMTEDSDQKARGVDVPEGPPDQAKHPLTLSPLVSTAEHNSRTEARVEDPGLNQAARDGHVERTSFSSDSRKAHDKADSGSYQFENKWLTEPQHRYETGGIETQPQSPSAEQIQAPTQGVSHGAIESSVGSAMHSDTKTDGRVPTSSAPVAEASKTGPAAATFLHSAQLYQQTSRTEMRITLRTPEIGTMELRTVVRDGQTAAVIAIEKGDVRSAVLAELPALQSALRDRHVELGQLSVTEYSDTGTGSSGGSAPDRNGHHHATQIPSDSSSTATETQPRSHSAAIPERITSGPGLSIHA